jgi:hypothetical protein
MTDQIKPIPAPHRHTWTQRGQYQKCEDCGATRPDPALAQAEAQESREMNRSNNPLDI